MRRVQMSKFILALLAGVIAVSFMGCERKSLYAGTGRPTSDEGATTPVETTCDTTQVETEGKKANNLEERPDLIRGWLNKRMFYVYWTSAYASDMENEQSIVWDFVCGEDTGHNEWIDQQEFNSLFRYRDWCIRTGYYPESGQWTVTFFTYFGFTEDRISTIFSSHENLTYALDPYMAMKPRFFGVPDDYSAEITSYDEDKHTVTLTFTSPEGETVDVYFNYVERCRCDENGTPLLNEYGEKFLYSK